MAKNKQAQPTKPKKGNAKNGIVRLLVLGPQPSSCLAGAVLGEAKRPLVVNLLVAQAIFGPLALVAVDQRPPVHRL
jgi:hypothetical protein